jgi:hypothetical protein
MDFSKMTEAQGVSLIINGVTLICILLIVYLYRNTKKFVRDNLFISGANVVLQSFSIWMAFSATYIAIYISAFVSQFVFLGSSLQMVNVLGFFKFLSPKVTTKTIKGLRIAFVVIFIINEIIMLCGLPFVLNGTYEVAPGKFIKLAVRIFVILNVLSQTTFFCFVSIFLTRGIYKVTRGDEMLKRYESNHERVVRVQKDLVIGKVFQNTVLNLSFLMLVYIVGIGAYVYYSMTERLSYLVLSMGVVGMHAIGTVIVLRNFADMITTYFGGQNSTSSGDSTANQKSGHQKV